MQKRRYAICGVSTRAIYMYVTSIVKVFPEVAEVVALLDVDSIRAKVCKKQVPGIETVLEYLPEQFDKMIEETKPNALIIACMDCFHIDYLLKGLERGLDVICEKPMCTNVKDVLRVMEAEKKSRGKVICTFNYRYNPVHRKLRELVLASKVGRVTHVDLNWYIDIKHGSSYFNRWNRMRKNSGSLSIHKSSHHFDLVNWWINGVPESVHAFGALNHYGPNGKFNPSKKDGRHCTTCEERMKCRYWARWQTRNSSLKVHDDHLKAFDSENGWLFTNYQPDMCIFDSEIDIYDTFVANVRYRNGVLLNYSANFSTPYEGYRLAINGTRGRIETMEFGGEGGMALPNLNEDGKQYIDLFTIFEGRERIHIPHGNTGGHGGGDPLILEDIFLGEDPNRKYDILAKSVDGLRAISIGDGIYNSIRNGGIQDFTSFIQ